MAGKFGKFSYHESRVWLSLKNSLVEKNVKILTFLRTLNAGVGLLDFGCCGKLRAIASRPRSNAVKNFSRLMILMRCRVPVL